MLRTLSFFKILKMYLRERGRESMSRVMVRRRSPLSREPEVALIPELWDHDLT